MSGKNLNREQLEAIEHERGPLLIIAGAGTGKTTVITERIRHLITDKNISPNQILALTFTEKAAYEMQERVDKLLPYGYTDLWIHTFHSFCETVLRDNAHFIGLDPNYKLISETESILLLRNDIFDLGLNQFMPLGNPLKFLDALLTHFSRLKDEDIIPDEYIRFAQNQKLKISAKGGSASGGKNQDELEAKQYLELAKAYKRYEEIKIKKSLMDFSDLISNTLLLFRKRKNILNKYQKQFKFLLVDEFQDTNFAQNELAILLAGDDKNITVVADDDQSIYRFRGAAVSNVLQFKKNFPEAKIITLINNYRSTQLILDSSYKLIQHNNPNRLEVAEKINKKLISNSKAQKSEIELIHERRAEDEADKIAVKILELNKKYKYNEIAILIRANNHSDLITRTLQRYKIPYQFLGPGYLFQQEEIKDLIAYLTFLTNLSDSVSLFRVLSMNILDISYVELNYLLNFAKKRNLSLFESLENLDQTFLKPNTKEQLMKFKKMVEKHINKSKRESAGQILFDFIVDTGIYNTLMETDSLKDEKRVQNIAKFFDRIKNFETDRKDANIFTLVDWLSLMLQMGDSPTASDIDIRDRNAVNILTVHSAKGLEFDVVFMANLVSDRFPTRERAEKIPIPESLIKENLPKNTDYHTQEERRLFYVGMTRAREKLFFTAADFYGTSKRLKKISQFVYEALPNLKEKNELEDKIRQLSFAEIISPYQLDVAEEEPGEPIKIDYITFSNLQMFDICPLHYKAKVIFNIPSPITGAQSFGISIHATLYEFYKKVQDGLTPSYKDLSKILEAKWIPEGYQNKKHEQERLLQAQKFFKEFFETDCNPPVKPLALELPFSFNLSNGVKVFGKMDRVDSKGGGIEIIDYKTGEDNPKAKVAHQLQMAIYALAASKIKDSVFDKKPEDITLTLHFLEGNTKKSMNFKKEDLEKLEDELIEKIEEIKRSNFKCSRSVLCINCEYKMLCNTIS